MLTRQKENFEFGQYPPITSTYFLNSRPAAVIGIERSFIKVIIEEKLRLSFGCLDDCRMNLRGIQVERYTALITFCFLIAYIDTPSWHVTIATAVSLFPSTYSVQYYTIHLNIQTKNLYHATGESFM